MKRLLSIILFAANIWLLMAMLVVDHWLVWVAWIAILGLDYYLYRKG